MQQGNHVKDRKMLYPILLALACIAMLIVAQTLLKLGVEQSGGISFTGGQVAEGIKKVFTSWQILTGIALYAISAILWLDVLTRLPISQAYPLVSLSYAAAVVIGAVVFHEPISWLRILAVVLICGGVITLIKS